jgi:hypothetical protein
MMTTMTMMMMTMKKKWKKERTKRRARRTSGRIGEVPLVLETVGVDSGVGVVIVVKTEEASVVVEEASVVGAETSAVVEEASAVVEEASVVVGEASEEASGIMMGRMGLEGGVEVSGVGVVEEEIGEDLGRVLMLTLAREIPEVKRSEDSRRRDLSSGGKKNIEFEAEILKVSVRRYVGTIMVVCWCDLCVRSS